MVAIVYVILNSITMVMAVSRTPWYVIKAPLITQPQKQASCLPLEEPCMESKDPCCTLIYKQTYLGLNFVLTTCFKFGKGVCQVNYSIKNFAEYSKLVRQLNGTNYRELKNKYWSTIPVA